MRSFPWDSVATSIGEDGYPVYDRVYQASDLREVYETFFSNGIFTDSETALKVSPGEGMTVRVAPGRCCINGTVGYEEEERELALTASGTMDRIDTVVLRWDSALDARNIDLYVLAGAPSETPVRPTLTRSETVWELGLCDVYVTAHMLQTKSEKMTDTRLDSARCGVVAPFVRLDTSNFYDQLQEQTQIAVDLAQAALDGTVVGQLQESINAVDEKADAKVSKAGDTMTGALTLESPLAVTSGGTGASSAADARVSLGALGAALANGYHGMTRPDGNAEDWIRTTQKGILPYQKGGSSTVGENGWPFSNIYTNAINLNGHAMFVNPVLTVAYNTTVTADNVASQGSSTKSATVTIEYPNGIFDYIAIPVFSSCNGYISTSKSGNKVIVSVTMRNPFSSTRSIACTVYIICRHWSAAEIS